MGTAVRLAIRIAAGALAAAGSAVAAHAQPVLDLPPIQTPPGVCAPEKVFRATVRNITPGLSAADRAAQPRQIWRQGSRFLRSVEQPVPPTGDQSLVIVAEPDIWMLNQATRTGRHAIDPGPTFDVHAPVLPVLPGLPPELRKLEFGCEPEFVAEHAPVPQAQTPWGSIRAAVHTFTVGDHNVAILMDSRRNEPLMISLLRGGRPVFVLRYDEWRRDLPFRPEFFTPPARFKIEEAASQPPPRPLD